MKEFSLHLKFLRLDRAQYHSPSCDVPYNAIHLSPRWGFRGFGLLVFYIHTAPLGLKREVVSCTYKYNLNQLHAYRVLCLRGRVDAVHYQSVSGRDVNILEPLIGSGAELE